MPPPLSGPTASALAVPGQAVLGPLLPLLRSDDGFASLAGLRNAVIAVPEPARAYAVAGLAFASGRHPLVVAVPTISDAERLTHDLVAFVGSDDVDLFPAWETLPFERVSPSVETMGRRLRTIWRLRGPGAGHMPRILVAPVRALLQRLGPHVSEVDPVVVRKGDQIDPEVLVARLVSMGYRREYQVEHRGELAVRGSIVDVFASTGDVPVRIDLWGDEVDRLTEFSVADQRSTDELVCAELFGCRELLPTADVRERAAKLVGEAPWARDRWERLAEGLVFDGMESWLPWLTSDEHTLLDLVPPGAQILLVEPRRMRDRAAELLDEEAALGGTLAQTWGAAGEAFPRLHLPFDRLLARTQASAWTLTPAPEGPGTTVMAAAGWDPVVGDGERLVAQLRGLVADGYRITVCTEGRGSGARVAGLLRDHGFTAGFFEGDVPEGELTRPGLRVVVQPLDRGFVYPALKLAVVAEGDVTGRRRAHRKARARARPAQTFFDDMKPGDYVVHHTHGVGRFGGMVRRGIGGVERDYLLLEYRGGDKLYVPSDQVDLLRPYTGGESPALSRLNGSEWQRTKSRVRQAVRDIAQELVVLYQRRVNAAGHAFGPDTPWQTEMEDAFPYVETTDQAKAIADVKADMEGASPMDRLICGDVGFGKTEIAIRAAFKAVNGGKQVAVLVPTTLLASQHFQTFADRFAGYPVRVEMLSRFLTPAQARQVTNGLADGSVDVVVGTHKLISGETKFKDLGLLVVDEEQRFGVAHKEAIKKLRTDVDVLTLTATPIPRTLEMSLTGIRDLTLLNTPPAERQPILTYVGEYDERAVAEAFRRELLREGQVFFVHNRVADIEKVAAELRGLVPEARIAVAHGQMDEAALEKVVFDFWEGRYDVLVCTTIIESGIDMPTVNTLVVDRADRLGLGQLHQLRGRVGRAGQRAYAYLLFPPDRVLSEEAYERLRTIGEHTELGSGFKIAMRDLEIRGAGNLLGGDQSGHIAAVGYDLYVQMVSEAVAELKGEERREPAEIKLDLPVTANLPGDYVSREDLRLEAYRRLATVTTHAEVDDIRSEWVDRYGPLPAPAQALLRIGHLRAECARLGLREVSVVTGAGGGSGGGLSGGGFSGGGATARLAPLALKASERVRFQRLWPKAVYKEDIGQLVLPLARGGDYAKALAEGLAALVPPSVASATP
ncbi:MAG TPA: transcription-repair coupling factor [Acidimicrobiales bacterium]|nr:transcription-repair coupling factor [Acidimicrobiales bacterium]